MNFTSDEQKLIEYSKKRILEIAKSRKSRGLYDILLAFALSDTGKIYEGTPLESTQLQASFCAERQAITNMIFAETENAKIKSILVSAPIPNIEEPPVVPCGSCRHVINEFGTPDVTILCAGYVRNDEDWTIFPKIEKYTAKELYPRPYIPTKW